MPGDLRVDSSDEIRDVVQFMVVDALDDRRGDFDRTDLSQSFDITKNRGGIRNLDVLAMKGCGKTFETDALPLEPTGTGWPRKPSVH